MVTHKHTLLKPFTEDQRNEFLTIWNRQHGLVITEDAAGIYADEPVVEITVADYDDAMEQHLTAERTARGYTTREPTLYANSANVRWRQDAEDWSKHIDEVMSYAMKVENDYIQGLPVPTLARFKNELPKIKWTLTA